MARIKIITPEPAGESTADGVRNKQPDGSALVWAAGTKHKYENTGVEYLEIEKGAGAATMTITTRVPESETYGLELPDEEIAIAASSKEIYGPYSPGAFNERSGTDKGFTEVAFSEVTGLFVKVIRPAAPVA